MTADLTLCVGGPLDGKRREIVGRYIVAPVRPSVAALEGPGGPAGDTPTRLVRYAVREWRTTTGGIHRVYAPTDWSEDQIMQTLINGYRP